MKDFKTIIYNWVKQNFGESEADDPSWNIEALAEHLSKSDINPSELNIRTKNAVYDELREQSLEETIEQVAENMGITLTKDTLSRVKKRYYKMDDETWEQVSTIIDNMNIMDEMEGE